MIDVAGKNLGARVPPQAWRRPVSKPAAMLIIVLWISGAAMLGWIAFVHRHL
jgi:hypothetical protein